MFTKEITHLAPSTLHLDERESTVLELVEQLEAHHDLINEEMVEDEPNANYVEELRKNSEQLLRAIEFITRK